MTEGKIMNDENKLPLGYCANPHIVEGLNIMIFKHSIVPKGVAYMYVNDETFENIKKINQEKAKQNEGETS